MELLFKKYFWLVHLLFLAVAMFVVAATGNLFVESAISAIPAGASQKHAVRTAAAEARAALDPVTIARLTGLPPPVAEPEIVEPTVAVVDRSSPPVHCGLRVKLLGTLLSSIPEWSIASIQDVVTQRTQTYMVGERVQGAEILEIERTRVIVLNNSRREFIDATPGDGSGAPVVAAPPSPSPQVAVAGDTSAPPSQAIGAGIRAVGENDYTVPRAEIDRTLSNLNDVAMQARIVPAFKNGVAQGFKLFSIRPDSLYTKIGMQNGDVIRRINGYDLNSPEKALEIYSKLKESSHIEIEVDRNGSTLRKSYNVQ